MNYLYINDIILSMFISKDSYFVYEKENIKIYRRLALIPGNLDIREN